MSLNLVELSEMKTRADTVIQFSQNEDARRVAADVLMLLLFLKEVREKNGSD